MLISGIFHLLFPDRGCLWVTKGTESETVGKGGEGWGRVGCCMTAAVAGHTAELAQACGGAGTLRGVGTGDPGRKQRASPGPGAGFIPVRAEFYQ